MRSRRTTHHIAALALVMQLAALGCVQRLNTRLTLPSVHRLVRDQLIVYSDFPLPSRHRLLEELTALRVDLAELLWLPVSNEPIHVYVFQTAQQFETAMHLRHPSFPQRRAFFVETDTRLEVYAQWGDRVGEDLRHEVTHGYLHSVVPSIPLWLDEGLAEYCEVPRSLQGLNQEHVETLVKQIEAGPWRPNLERLEALRPETDMTQLDYAEAWAWVHYLVARHPSGRDLLAGHVGDLRRHGRARPLSSTLRHSGGQIEDQLVAHVQELHAAAQAR